MSQCTPELRPREFPQTECDHSIEHPYECVRRCDEVVPCGLSSSCGRTRVSNSVCFEILSKGKGARDGGSAVGGVGALFRRASAFYPPGTARSASAACPDIPAPAQTGARTDIPAHCGARSARARPTSTAAPPRRPRRAPAGQRRRAGVAAPSALFERLAVSSIASEESSAMPFRGTRHAVSRHSSCPSDELCAPRRRDDCGALSVARGVVARVGLRERPLLALRPRAESGFGRSFCARHCVSTRRGDCALQGPSTMVGIPTSSS